MISLAHAGTDARVLEPCCGEGVFLDRLLAAGYTDLTAYEIDASLLPATQHNVSFESFVTAELEGEFDLVIGNPPYVRWRDMDVEQREELQRDPLWNERFTSLSDYLTIFIAKAAQALR